VLLQMLPEPRPGLTKMGRFDNFLVAKHENEQTTSGNGQNAADQNQFCRHEEFLSRKLAHHLLSANQSSCFQGRRAYLAGYRLWIKIRFDTPIIHIPGMEK
jgi:hypothetical protein